MQNSPAHTILKIHRGDTQYPARLNDLYDPPECLYLKGDIRLLNMPMIAVVGARMASSGGLRHAAIFAQALSKAGALVVSGLAKGLAPKDGSLKFQPASIPGAGRNQKRPACLNFVQNCVYPLEIYYS